MARTFYERVQHCWDKVQQHWLNRDPLKALTTAWTMPVDALYSPASLHADMAPRLHHETPRLPGLVSCACQAAIKQAWEEESGQAHSLAWLQPLLCVEPTTLLMLYCGDQAWHQRACAARLYAHLCCTELVLTSQTVSDALSDAALQEVATTVQQKSNTQTPLPLAWLRDLTHPWLDQPPRPPRRKPRHTQKLCVLLVHESPRAASRPVVADLVLELLPAGAGELYHDPRQAFLVYDEAFAGAADTARAYLQRGGVLWPKGLDVRWRLDWGDPQGQFPLTGNSLGAAFALGLAKLLAHRRRPLAPCLRQLNIEDVAITATIDGCGRLGDVGYPREKAQAAGAVASQTPARLRYMVVAACQDDLPGAVEHASAGGLCILRGATLREAVDKLAHARAPEREEQRFKNHQCLLVGMLAIWTMVYSLLGCLGEISLSSFLLGFISLPILSCIILVCNEENCLSYYTIALILYISITICSIYIDGNHKEVIFFLYVPMILSLVGVLSYRYARVIKNIYLR